MLKKVACVVGVGLFLSVVGHAQIVDVDGIGNCGPANAATLDLPAGIYSVTQIDQAGGGAYTAWNAWGFVSGCDGSGANCSNGWLTSYDIFIPGVLADGFGGGTYETADLAFANEAEDTCFVLPVDETVEFFIDDFPACGDNLGGVSLLVATASACAAAPALPVKGIAVLLSLLVAAGVLLLRR